MPKSTDVPESTDAEKPGSQKPQDQTQLPLANELMSKVIDKFGPQPGVPNVVVEPNMPNLALLADEHTTLVEVPVQDVKVEVFLDQDPLITGDGSSPEGK